MDGTAATLQEAVRQHQQGKLAAARALYDLVLQSEPRQFDALHLRGVVARQEGQATLAVALISQAIGINPEHAAARCNLGAALQDLGRSGEALASYERAVELDPGYALAFCNRGNALRKLGRHDEALASYDRALALRPAYPEAWCNRSMLLQDVGRSADALASAEQALATRPGYADAWCARGNALQGLDRFEEAVASYDRALGANAANAEAWCSRGAALKRLQDLGGALASYDRAIALNPGYATAHHYRANTLRALGRDAEAVGAYRQALALGADAAQVGFALAALGQGEAPDASPQEYVKELFDQYAGHFDRHLVDVLGYRTPALLGEALWMVGVPEGVDSLDLGCGTGLLGPVLRPFSRTLAGVDLSGKMLEKARERGLYDRLECAAIGQFLDGRSGEFGLVAAADVFVYFGDLTPVFTQVHRALRPGGWFCFSVEACEEGDFTLRPSNRYAHSLAYLRRIAHAAGFEELYAEEACLRTDDGVPVMGRLVVLRRAS